MAAIWPTGWNRARSVTIDHNHVGDTLTDVPILLWRDDDAELSDALANGHDYRCRLDGSAVDLEHERLHWSGGGGSALTARIWQYVPTLSTVADTVLWAFYDNGDAADGEDAAGVWDPSDHEAVWHMTSNGGMEYDSTGNSENLTETGGSIPTATGKIHTARDFEASETEWLECDDGGSVDIAGADQPLTVEAWVKHETAATQTWLGKWTYAPDGRQYMLIRRGDGKAGFYLSDIGTTETAAYGATTIGTGSWYYLAGVYDGSEIRVYVNGSLDSNGAANPKTYSSGIYDGTSKFAAGCYSPSGTPGGYFDGLLESAMISSAARSAAWVAFRYDNVNESDHTQTWGAEITGLAVAAPVLTVDAALVAPTIDAQRILAAPVLTADATLLGPTIALAAALVAPVLTVDADLVAPTIHAPRILAAPVLTVDADLVAPAIGHPIYLAAPVLTVDADLVAPTIDAPRILAAPVLTVDADLVAPAIGHPIFVAAPVLTVDVALVGPTIPLPRTVAAPVLTVDAILVGPGFSLGLLVGWHSAAGQIHLPAATGQPYTIGTPGQLYHAGPTAGQLHAVDTPGQSYHAGAVAGQLQEA